MWSSHQKMLKNVLLVEEKELTQKQCLASRLFSQEFYSFFRYFVHSNTNSKLNRGVKKIVGKFVIRDLENLWEVYSSVFLHNFLFNQFIICHLRSKQLIFAASNFQISNWAIRINGKKLVGIFAVNIRSCRTILRLKIVFNNRGVPKMINSWPATAKIYD